MANITTPITTPTNNALVTQEWADRYQSEYVRKSGFLAYMGLDDQSPIQVYADVDQGRGTIVNIPTVGALKGAGVRGSSRLMGSEEKLGQYNVQVTTQMIRNAVSVNRADGYQTKLDVLNIARGALKTWSARTLRNDIIDTAGLLPIAGSANSNGTLPTDTFVSYGSATTGQKNAFVAANTDRVVFGNSLSNHSSGNMATSLGLVDGTTGRMSAATLRLVKQQFEDTGETNGLKINPFMTDNGEEWIIGFVGSAAFRDLLNDSDIKNANLYARPREQDFKKNPIANAGFSSIQYNGVMVVKVPELSRIKIAGAGASGIDIGRSFFVGSNFLNLAYTARPKFFVQEDDYTANNGVAVEETRGQTLVSYGGVANMVQTFTAAMPS